MQQRNPVYDQKNLVHNQNQNYNYKNVQVNNIANVYPVQKPPLHNFPLNRIPLKGSFNDTATKLESYHQRNSENLHNINSNMIPPKNACPEYLYKDNSLRVHPQNLNKDGFNSNAINSEPNHTEHNHFRKKNENKIIKLKVSSLDALKKNQLDKRSSSLDSHFKTPQVTNKQNLIARKIVQQNIISSDNEKIFKNPLFDHNTAKKEIKELEAKIRNTISKSPMNKFNDSRGSGRSCVNLFYNIFGINKNKGIKK